MLGLHVGQCGHEFLCSRYKAGGIPDQAAVALSDPGASAASGQQVGGVLLCVLVFACSPLLSVSGFINAKKNRTL